MSERIEIDSFPKNSQELLVVALQRHYGELVCDIRSAVIRTTGLKLLRKGVTIRAYQLPRLVRALQKALDALEGLGEIKPEKKEEGPDPWEIEPIEDDELPF